MDKIDISYDALLMQSKDKRLFHRQRVFKSGLIFFNNGCSSFACKVKNQNLKGAMLECASTFSIPTEIKLKIGGQGGSVPAKVIWRTQTKLGISLADPQT